MGTRRMFGDPAWDVMPGPLESSALRRRICFRSQGDAIINCAIHYARVFMQVDALIFGSG
jgi:hypothetical protein